MGGAGALSVLNHVAEGTDTGFSRRMYLFVRPPVTEVGLIMA